MVIWPEKIDRDDENWLQACALMQVLALDPRRHNDNATSKPRSFFESADDYLVRPNIWVDRKQVAAPTSHTICASMCPDQCLDRFPLMTRTRSPNSNVW